MPELLEKNSYTKWLTVLDSPGAYTVEEQRNEIKNRIYEYHFKVSGRAAKFYELTRVECINEEWIGIHKQPKSCPREVGEEIKKHHPKLQPIVRWEEFDTPKCAACGSDLLYSDKKEEYICPFCNNE